MITAKSFAVRNGYEVQADREFMALGFANIVSGLSSGFPIAGADSRTAINDLTGGRSQVSGLTAAVVMAVVLAPFTAPLAYIPNAFLGAALVLAGVSLFDFQALRRIWSIQPGGISSISCCDVGVSPTIGVLPGIALAIALSVTFLLVRVSNPYDAILGQVPGVDGLTDISEYAGA
jgi:MFS superfamily sulfate permease-like transporter